MKPTLSNKNNRISFRKCEESQFYICSSWRKVKFQFQPLEKHSLDNNETVTRRAEKKTRQKGERQRKLFVFILQLSFRSSSRGKNSSPSLLLPFFFLYAFASDTWRGSSSNGGIVSMIYGWYYSSDVLSPSYHQFWSFPLSKNLKRVSSYLHRNHFSCFYRWKLFSNVVFSYLLVAWGIKVILVPTYFSRSNKMFKNKCLTANVYSASLHTNKGP